jgi:hypothetical protein
MIDISNQDDTIDSREIILRIAELEEMEELEDYQEDELDALKELEEECSNFSDWADGLTFIRDGYFDEYAQDLAMEIYNIDVNVWPFTCIDWDDVADKLKDDYTTVDFGDEQYWVRSY